MSSTFGVALPDAYAHDVYVLRRSVFSLTGRKSKMYDARGNLLLYSVRKRFRLKEDIRIFDDEAGGREMLAVRARSVIDLGATYDVFDSQSGEQVGALRRNALKSMLRDQWSILGVGDAHIGSVVEDSAMAAFLRRFSDVVSFVSPQSYTISVGGRPVGAIKQHMNPFVLSYTMDLSGDPNKSLDRRLAVAAAILLLNIEGRQD
jgi:hypothetical protein